MHAAAAGWRQCSGHVAAGAEGMCSVSSLVLGCIADGFCRTSGACCCWTDGGDIACVAVCQHWPLSHSSCIVPGCPVTAGSTFLPARMLRWRVSCTTTCRMILTLARPSSRRWLRTASKAERRGSVFAVKNGFSSASCTSDVCFSIRSPLRTVGCFLLPSYRAGGCRVC